MQSVLFIKYTINSHLDKLAKVLTIINILIHCESARLGNLSTFMRTYFNFALSSLLQRSNMSIDKKIGRLTHIRKMHINRPISIRFIGTVFTRTYRNNTLLPNQHFSGCTEITGSQRVEIETTRYLLAEFVTTIPICRLALAPVDTSRLMP